MLATRGGSGVVGGGGRHGRPRRVGSRFASRGARKFTRVNVSPGEYNSPVSAPLPRLALAGIVLALVSACVPSTASEERDGSAAGASGTDAADSSTDGAGADTGDGAPLDAAVEAAETGATDADATAATCTGLDEPACLAAETCSPVMARKLIDGVPTGDPEYLGCNSGVCGAAPACTWHADDPTQCWYALYACGPDGWPYNVYCDVAGCKGPCCLKSE